MNIIPVQFDDYDIRRVYDEKTETWYFSVVDIIRVLLQQPDFQAARNYWKVLRNRLSKEGSESVTKCNRPLEFERFKNEAGSNYLKYKAEKNGPNTASSL